MITVEKKIRTKYGIFINVGGGGGRNIVQIFPFEKNNNGSLRFRGTKFKVEDGFIEQFFQC